MISFVSGMPYSESASSVLDRSRAATPASDSFASVLANTRAGGQTASIANLQFAMQASKSVANAQTTGLAAKSSAKTGQAAAKPLIYDLRQCGYFSLADENGRITYKGVTFQCDRQKNRLTLGDVSNEKNCIKVGLARGGSLVFNKNSKGDLLKALQMFDKEDQDRIWPPYIRTRSPETPTIRTGRNRRIPFLEWRRMRTNARKMPFPKSRRAILIMICRRRRREKCRFNKALDPALYSPFTVFYGLYKQVLFVQKNSISEENTLGNYDVGSWYRRFQFHFIIMRCSETNGLKPFWLQAVSAMRAPNNYKNNY